MANKYVYLFSEGNATMRNLLGGKGANLAEMVSLGLPVPQGFTITTEACTRYYDDGEKISDDIINEIKEYMKKLEEICGKKFGDLDNPFLVSVRSGARASMPGMMDTILNLGLNDQTVESVARLTNNERFAYDSYRRFIQMFSDVVMEVEKSKFDAILEDTKEKANIKLDSDLNAQQLKQIVKEYKELFKNEKGFDFPQDPETQLIEAITAVFRSWDNPRAIYYRRINDIPGDWGTAVNVQSMVFGNMGNDCGTGVAFTRNPATGENKLYGEFLMNAQGEDVVAGIRTPQQISELEKSQPEVYKEFCDLAKKLEVHYKDMQDMEFTIEKGKLYMLQTRSGKRTAASAMKIAVDLVAEGLNTKEEALMKIDPRSLDTLLHPTFEEGAIKKAEAIATGLPASPGAATGQIYFNAEDAVVANDDGKKVILVRLETSPEDIEGMNISQGILTARGGMTSHAAVVARGIGTCCVAGCSEVTINESKKTVTGLDGKVLKEGDWISLDGSTGKVYAGKIDTKPAKLTGDFATIMGWADATRTLSVRTNADTPADAQNAINFGAEGIGLCRTEHMFFEADRIRAMREMIVAKDTEARVKALDKLLPIQRQDFIDLYKVLQGKPATIRFLDPPLHEFLPKDPAEIADIAKELNVTLEDLNNTIESLHEFNPMLGHRGCRLAISYPEIAAMQARAVIEAAIEVNKEFDYNVVPEIMIPLVGDIKELQFVKKVVVDTAEKVFKEKGCKVDYLVGTMIEVPRAALTADEIATEADFFSFGTNDLTQMTFGFSRDDAGSFLSTYYEKKIFESDPFARVDQKGVGQLLKIAVEKGRSTKPNLKIGICGEHGGDPSSIEFCHNLGLNYVSCSPFRVPIARLAAAQAKLNEKK